MEIKTGTGAIRPGTAPLTGPQGAAPQAAPGSPDAMAPAQAPAVDLGSALGTSMSDVRGLLALDESATAALDQLAAQGKLTPEVKAELSKLASQPLAPGVDRAALLGAAVRHLADPTTISQGDQMTCAAAVVQATTAKQNPAEYLRLIGGLASPEGKVTLANGDTIARDANWNAGTGRSVVDNLMQPAFMQYATGGQYDARTDTRKTASGTGQGLFAAEQDKLTGAVTGKQVVSVLGSGPEVMRQMAAAANAGGPVSAILKVTDPQSGQTIGHAVQVESVKDGMVTYLDPHAGRKTVSEAEFQAGLQSVSLPKEHVTPTLAKATMGQDEGMLAGGFFRRVGRFFRRVGRVLKKAMPIISIALMFIPGGQIAAIGWLNTLKTVVNVANTVKNVATAVKNKNWLGAVAGVAGAAAGAIGGAAGKAAETTARVLKAADTVRTAAKNGNGLGALVAAAGAVGGITDNTRFNEAMNTIATGGRVVQAVQQKNFAGALQGAAGLAEANGANGAAENLRTAAEVAVVVQAAEQKNLAGALQGAAGLAEANGAAGLAAPLRTGAQAAAGVQAARNGDLAGAVQQGRAVIDDVELPGT